MRKMSLLGLYLVTMETFVVQRSRSAPPSMMYATLENALDQWEREANCKRCTAWLQFWWTNRRPTCTFNFIFIDSLNHRFSYHPTPNAPLQIANQLLFEVSKRSFLCTWTTRLTIGRVTRKCIFPSASMSRLAKALQLFFAENRVVEPF